MKTLLVLFLSLFITAAHADDVSNQSIARNAQNVMLIISAGVIVIDDDAVLFVEADVPNAISRNDITLTPVIIVGRRVQDCVSNITGGSEFTDAARTEFLCDPSQINFGVANRVCVVFLEAYDTDLITTELLLSDNRCLTFEARGIL